VFVPAAAQDEQDAAVSVALASWFRAHRAVAAPASAGGAWRRAARTEATRQQP
jgi:hypothetical protein